MIERTPLALDAAFRPDACSCASYREEPGLEVQVLPSEAGRLGLATKPSLGKDD